VKRREDTAERPTPVPDVKREELERLLSLNFAVVDALTGKKLRDKRLVYIDTLARKLFQHGVTAFALWTNHTRAKISGLDFGIDFVDLASIQVLARACLETYLAFHYIYEDACDDDEFEFRYSAWMLAGFVKRESFPVLTQEAWRQVTTDATVNKRERRRIRKTARFQQLKPGTQKQVLDGRNWHPGTSLSALSERILGRTWGKAMYSYLSSYAHSDALSAVQMQQMVSTDRTLGFAATTMLTIGIIVAQMTASYGRKFVVARKILQGHADRELNELYASFPQYLPLPRGPIAGESVSCHD